MAERNWLVLDVVRAAVKAAKARGVAQVASGRGGFAQAYGRARGRPEALGTHTPTGMSWRDRRNGFVARHMAQVDQGSEALWTTSGEPTARHLALAVWAYSPQPKRLARWLMGEGYLR